MIEISLRIISGMKREKVLETSETEEDIERGKLQELSESKTSRLSEDAEYFGREMINVIARSDEKMENVSKITE